MADFMQTDTDTNDWTLLDLPEPLLSEIISKLEIDDKKSLAGVNKQFLALIRTYWKVCAFNVRAQNEPTPNIAHWPNITTFLIADDDEAISKYLVGEDWDEELYWHHHPSPPIGRDIRQELVTIGAILNAACDGGKKRRLKFALASQQCRRAREILDILYIPLFAKQNTSDTVYQSLLNAGHSALPRLTFDHLLDSKSNQDPAQSRVGRNASTTSGSTRKSNDTTKKKLTLPPPRRPSAVGGSNGTILTNNGLGGETTSTETRIKRSPPFLWVLANGNHESKEENFFGSSIVGEVDAGFFSPDGSLTSVITRGMVTWCLHTDQRLKFGAYSALKALRLWIPACEAYDMELEESFQQRVAPQLNSTSLPQLKELHIGRPVDAPFSLILTSQTIQIPQLTSLVLSGRVGINSFETLTHLTSLQNLEVVLSEYADEVEGHPRDVAVLQSLKNLQSLTVKNWQIRTRQEISSLQQLTELHLYNFNGPLNLIKPSGDMPNIKGLTLSQQPTTEEMRYIEDSVFVRWAIRKIHKRLRNVEVLHLGTLGVDGLIPEIGAAEELDPAAKVIDLHASVALSKSKKLRYLQLDAFLEIEGNLYRLCESGGVHLERTFKDYSGGKWERSVMFLIEEVSDALVAEFHYNRIGEGGDNGVSDDANKRSGDDMSDSDDE